MCLLGLNVLWEAEPLWIHKISSPNPAEGTIFLQIIIKSYRNCVWQDFCPIIYYYSEQYTWCTCWNSDQTEQTDHVCGPGLQIAKGILTDLFACLLYIYSKIHCCNK